MLRVLTVLVGAFVIVSGCITPVTPGGTTNTTTGGDKPLSGFSLLRELVLDVNKDNVAAADRAERNGGSPDPYLFIRSEFVVKVHDQAASPADLKVTYLNRVGVTRTVPLSDFTTKATLLPGDTVRVPDVNITSGGVLTHQGSEVAKRHRPAEAWWNAGGYPLGVRMEPGSGASWAFAGRAHEQIDLRNVVVEQPNVAIDRLGGRVTFLLGGLLNLDYGPSSEQVTAEGSHLARPLAWSANGTVSVPALVEFTGRNLSSGQKVDAGVEVLPVTGGTFSANGKVWINASGSPVRADLDAGSFRTDADVVAWLTGVRPEEVGDFSCANRAKADQCRPTEIPFNEMRRTETAEPDKENLDSMPWMPQREIVQNLSAFLAEDLVVGDRIHVVVKVDSRELPDWRPSSNEPEYFKIDFDLDVKVASTEKVTVRAGVFDTLRVDERSRVALEIGSVKNFDGTEQFRGIKIDQTLVEGTIWLDPVSFVPVRMDRTAPLQVGRILKDLVVAIPDSAWADAPFAPIRPENVDATIEGRGGMELTRLAGTVRFAPWLVFLGGSQIGSLVPAVAAGFGFGGFGGPAYMDSTYPCAPPPGGDGYAYPCDPYGPRYPPFDGNSTYWNDSYGYPQVCPPRCGSDDPNNYNASHPDGFEGTFAYVANGTEHRYYFEERGTFTYVASRTGPTGVQETIQKTPGRYDWALLYFDDGTVKSYSLLDQDTLEIDGRRYARS